MPCSTRWCYTAPGGTREALTLYRSTLGLGLRPLMPTAAAPSQYCSSGETSGMGLTYRAQVWLMVTLNLGAQSAYLEARQAGVLPELRANTEVGGGPGVQPGGKRRRGEMHGMSG